MNVTMGMLCWAAVCGIVFGLQIWHWPFWLAVVVGVPLGFVLGFILFSLLCGLLIRLRQGKPALPDEPRGSLIEDMLIPTLIVIALTLALGPVYVKAKHLAAQHRREQAIHVAK